MRRRSRFNITAVLAVACLVTALAGCLGTAPEAKPTPPDVPTDPGPEPPPTAPAPEWMVPPLYPQPAATWSPFRMALQAPVNETYQEEGAFSPEETGLGGGFITGGFQKEVDLTHLLPAHIPTRIHVVVTLDATTLPGAGPTGRADPVSNGTVWYDSVWRTTGADRFELEGVAKRAPDGTFKIAIEAYAPGLHAPPGVQYAVRANASAHPEWVPVGVPVALPATAQSTLRFETRGGDEGEALIYGADDRLLDRLYFDGAEEWRIPTGQGDGLVVLPIYGTSDLRILRTTNDSDGQSLRALDLTHEVGRTYDVAPMETTGWSFELDRRPLRIFVTLLGPGGAPWTCAGSLELRLIAPEDPLMEQTVECPAPTNVPFLYEEVHTWRTHHGDARVLPGTYEVRVENTLWQGHQAYHMVEWFER